MTPSHENVLAGGGEMGALMRSVDWSTTPVGPIEQWPQSLRTALSILLETGFPMYIAWGAEFTQFYNDGYRPILGSTKHPAAMGASTRDTFAEIWEIIGPMFEGVMAGRPTTVVDFLLPLDRHGFSEECYFVFSYSPIREESGQVGGVLVTVAETTARVLGERRLRTTRALAAETREAQSVEDALRITGDVLAQNPADLPATAIYLLDQDARMARLVEWTDEDADAVAPDETIAIDQAPFRDVLRTGRVATTEAQASLPVGGQPSVGGRTLVLPITQQGADRPLGILLARTSPRLLVDRAYHEFIALVAAQIGTIVAAARALEESRARAEALAELDRAKTVFFSNVSHEFRTPLTLMLGPTEEALASPDRALQGENLETVHRNELRLLKLVNTLLDFSRIEAGRMSATFESTDLAELTANLASAFRSATEQAGLELRVNCPELPHPVHVDRTMWEKVVLNLLSNALKFTFEGSIEVSMSSEDGQAVLRVRDTGVGIAAGDLERIFERFQRIDRVAARTHEGSGIGLALVRELVGMHGGTIAAESEPGVGTTFTVRVPLGVAHLPRDMVVPGDREGTGHRPDPRPYVQEALRWLDPATPGAEEATTVAAREALPLVLVADDNADMREYLVRLLEPRFRVEVHPDGCAALEAVRASRPDVIITDVMMPRMDGFEFLAALREEAAARTIPVILLSARAGEEARVEGLEAGADDYLTKPFSARELLARVDAQLVRAKLRALEEANEARFASVFEHAPVGVALFNGPEMRFVYANAHYMQLIDNRPVLGRTVREAFPELEGQQVFEQLDHAFQSGEHHVGRTVRAVLDDNGVAWERFFDVVYQPIRDQRGTVTGLAVVVFDVTELSHARREAEAASRARDEFLAMLGHELRNPLAPIVTALQVMRLRRGAAAPDRELQIIERQVQHLVALLDDLLDVSRIVRGKVPLKRSAVNVQQVTAEAVEMIRPAIETRGHHLEVAVPEGLVVHADSRRIAQILANLLRNAAKYTERGGRITLTADRDGDEVVVSVADTGRGIAPEMLPQVFEMFSQEHQELDRAEGGLGLGLAIVRNLVEAHGGSVTAASEGKGRGSTFTVRLPIGAPEARVEPGDLLPAIVAEDRPLRILVVDDNADAIEVMASLLRHHGHEVQTAVDGPSALRAAAGQLPDVALLDLGLPGMDGYELAARLRMMQDGHRLSVVAVTGYGLGIDRERTRTAGFDGHLVKPIETAALLATIDRAIRRPPSRVPG